MLSVPTLATVAELPGGRHLAVVALALAAAVGLRSWLRDRRGRRRDGPPSTTMDDFVDP